MVGGTDRSPSSPLGGDSYPSANDLNIQMDGEGHKLAPLASLWKMIAPPWYVYRLGRLGVLAACIAIATCYIPPSISPAIRGRGAGVVGYRCYLHQGRWYRLDLLGVRCPQASLSIVFHMKTIIA